ncbi:MAG: T9SS type A sorting domain-containing protein [Flavobacteriales bacterium]|nr:T9SS type A sorting domain-containing protein [Flavobacteriales bacterium]
MRTFILLIIASLNLQLSASNTVYGGTDPYEVRLVDKSHHEMDEGLQFQIRSAMPWSSFTNAHPAWLARFDEDNFKPVRAFGPAIPTSGTDAESRAMNFIEEQLVLFNIPMEDLQMSTVTDNGKHDQAFFTQYYEGLEVMYSQAMVKMLHSGHVISWSAIVHNDIDVDITPLVSHLTVIEAASSDIPDVTDVHFTPELKILPIPKVKDYEHHLVYEVMVDAIAENGIPANYLTHVDAHTGEVLQRINQTHTFHGPECSLGEEETNPPVINANVTGEFSYPDPNYAAEAQTLSSMRVIVDGTTYFTDSEGNVTIDAIGSQSAQFFMSGTWASVVNESTGSVTNGTLELSEGDNQVDVSPLFSVDEMTAFHNTNVIHDYVNHVLPDWDGMDYPMSVNVGITPHECNAFSTGNGINFYVSGFTCVSLARVADVVFHEYGHEINDNFYNELGANFSNGAMNEGYADVWAFLPIQDPVLADGHNPQDPEDYIRRYDINPKVYPQDLVGQVHADGEIIAGAWWDTFLLLGNDQETIEELWRLHYPGLQAATFNGNEGSAYLNVLIDVLEADDDDGNILNGTPNGAAISEGFAIHGITFLATADLGHDVVESFDAFSDINIMADLGISGQFTDYLGGVLLRYRLNDSPDWVEVEMNEIGGENYEAVIPGQAPGTIIAYYMAVRDIFDNLAVVNPIGANLEDPKLPHYTLVGYELFESYDSDDEDEITGWELGIDTDEATTGIWEEVDPLGSFLNGVAVAVDQQATEGGEFCFVTGNSFNVNDGIGVNDVDAGTTTLMSEAIDLTSYIAPAFTYKRWYTNATGANPNADWWQVQVSDDGGESWVYVEDTKSSDARWRRNAFRISDYVDLTDNFMIKFNASDSLRPGTNLDGGSLIEAGLDDFMLYDRSLADGLDESEIVDQIDLFPNPSSDVVNLAFELNTASAVDLQVFSVDGRLIHSEGLGMRQGYIRHQIEVGEWAKGSYTLELQTSDGRVTRSITVR